MKAFIGIDPGKEGAITILDKEGNVKFMSTFPKIKKEIDTNDMARMFADLKSYGGMIVGIEDVHALFGSSSKATFNFGHICGFILGLVVGNKYPYVEIQPKVWQKVMFEGVPELFKPMKEGQKKKVRDTKAMALLAAKRLFPDIDLRATQRSTNPHDGIVDSLLIAEFVRRKY